MTKPEMTIRTVQTFIASRPDVFGPMTDSVVSELDALLEGDLTAIDAIKEMVQGNSDLETELAGII